MGRDGVRGNVKARGLGLVMVLALSFAPAANAKFRMSLTVGDSTPRVGQPITVVLRSERELDYDLKLIAVAPGKSWYDVVGRVTGDSRLAKAQIPRDGFGVAVTRTAGGRWRAFVSFPRPGRWRLIIVHAPRARPRERCRCRRRRSGGGR